MSRSEFFSYKLNLDTSNYLNTSKDSGLNSFINGKTCSNTSKTRQTNNQLFRVPNFDSIPVKRGTLKSVVSPKRRLPSGRVKKELKLSQQSKVNFRPSMSFLNASRKSVLKGGKSNQIRKELVKKMVCLAEFALQNNPEMKQSTPVKATPIFTPKRTPRVRKYLALPEFAKTAPNINEIRSPLKEFIKKETLTWSSSRQTPDVSVLNRNFDVNKKRAIFNESYANEIAGADSTVADAMHNSSTALANASEIELNLPENASEDLSQILGHFQSYNDKVSRVFDKLNLLKDRFETTVKEHPILTVYEEFCTYRIKKEEIYEQMKVLENELMGAIKEKIDSSERLKYYVKENRELLLKQIKLHKEFESMVQEVASKLPGKEIAEKIVMKKESKKEVPKLRRSLRLSKLPKKEATPVQMKLSRLSTISKGIQKTRKSPCCKRSKVLH